MTKLYSVAGLDGGSSIPRPGEISLAHHGVLFLDELPEFRRDVLEVMRQPLEDGVVTISRAQMALTYLAQFTLAAALNPCPCGYRGDVVRPCNCSPFQAERFWTRLSGPLSARSFDRILKVARTIADLAAEPAIKAAHVAEAIQYRTLDRTKL